MAPVSESTVNRLHLAVALTALWLIGTSPWIGMLRRVPAGASWIDRAHVTVGWAGLVLGLLYAAACLRGGGWRRLLPWNTDGIAGVGRDVAGLARGQVPSAEGVGLFSAIEGLLLVVMLIAGAAGAGWYLAQGGDTALAWRSVHVVTARVLIGLFVLHLAAVASHLADFAR